MLKCRWLIFFQLHCSILWSFAWNISTWIFAVKFCIHVLYTIKNNLRRNIVHFPIARITQEILGPYPILHTHHTLVCAGCVQWAGGCRGQGSAGGQRQGQLLLQRSGGYGRTRFLFLLEHLWRILRRTWVARHLNSRVSSTVSKG